MNRVTTVLLRHPLTPENSIWADHDRRRTLGPPDASSSRHELPTARGTLPWGVRGYVDRAHRGRGDSTESWLSGWSLPLNWVDSPGSIWHHEASLADDAGLIPVLLGGKERRLAATIGHDPWNLGGGVTPRTVSAIMVGG